MDKQSRALLIVFITLLTIACRDGREGYLEPLLDMERDEYRGQELKQERIEEIRQGIRKYRKEVERKVEATAQLGVYYKMLAVQFMSAAMYQEAYKSLKEALAIHTENPILFYLSGLCAARISKAQVEAEAKELWRGRAESLYNRALEFDPVYTDALFGLSVLMVFELNRAEDAEPLLKKILARESKNIEAMFLLAHVYYRSGRLEGALQLYDSIVRSTSVKARKEEALSNKERIEEELYGAR